MINKKNFSLILTLILFLTIFLTPIDAKALTCIGPETCDVANTADVCIDGRPNVCPAGFTYCTADTIFAVACGDPDDPACALGSHCDGYVAPALPNYPNYPTYQQWIQLNFNVTNSCDGTGIGGASVTISQDFGNGSGRTTDGSGFANFGIWANTGVSWAVSKGGYTNTSGNVNSGNDTTVSTALTPNGGCALPPSYSPSYPVYAPSYGPSYPVYAPSYAPSYPSYGGVAGPLTGFVYKDLNTFVCCSGVKNPGEPGIPGESVRLYARSGTDRLLSTVVTQNGNGSYSFPSPLPALNAGEVYYVAHTVPAGYVRTTDDGKSLGAFVGAMSYDFGLYQQMSGTLLPASSSCTIASGASSCTTPLLTWTTTNPIGTSAITSATGIPSPVNGNNGSQTFTAPYNVAGVIFNLYNSAVLLGQALVTTNCAVGTSWNGTICASAVGSATLTANPLVIYSGTASTLTWSCASPSGVGTNFQTGNQPSGNVSVSPNSTTTYTLTCSDTSTAQVTVVVKKKPFFIEP